MTTNDHHQEPAPKFPIDPARLAEFACGIIAKGSHPDDPKTRCAEEWAAYLFDGTHTDRPSCVAPTIRAATIRLNDAISDDAQRTAIMRLVTLAGLGTVASRDVEWRRAFFAVDWAVHKTTPILLEAVGWKDLADRLRAAEPITDRERARRVQREVTLPVRNECWKRRRDAAAAAAYAAAAAAAADAAAYAYADAAYAYADADAAYAYAYADADADARKTKLRKARDETFASIAEMILAMCAIREEAA